jgi:hypothetical protein
MNEAADDLQMQNWLDVLAKEIDRLHGWHAYHEKPLNTVSPYISWAIVPHLIADSRGQEITKSAITLSDEDAK